MFSLDLWYGFDTVKTNGIALIIMSKSNIVMIDLVII